MGLLLHRLTADQLVGNVLQRADDRLVVVRHGHVIARRGHTQLRAQAAAVEDRQADGRPDVVVELAPGKEFQRPATGGHEAQAPDQVNVGEETGVGDVDTTRLRGHLPAAGDHVGALADQLGRQGRRQFQRGGEGQAGALDLRALTRPLARQRGQLVAGKGDFFVQAIQLAVGFGQRCFGLADLKMSADTAVQAALGQSQDLLLLLQLGLDDVALGEVQAELNVGTHHIVLQFQLRLAGLGHAHVCLVHGLFAGIALAPPEVQGIAEADGGVVVPGVGTRQCARAIELVFRPVVAFERRLTVGLQLFCRLDHTGHGLGCAHPRCGHGQGRATGHSQVEPTIELWITVGVPPLLVGPAGIAGGFADGRIGGQGIGLEGLALWGNAPGSDTAAQGEAKGTGTERLKRSDDATRHSCDFPRKRWRAGQF
ncbi:hypothetical protein D3C78_995080 [compost metagenome]